MESVHHLMKTVAGAVNLRPAWFFDTEEQGEALADVATHLVDLVPWTLFPGQPIDHRTEVAVLAARRWPTVLDEAQLLRLTGERALPATLAARVRGRQARLRRERRGVLHRPRGARPRQVLWTTRPRRGPATPTSPSCAAAGRGSRSCRGRSRSGARSCTWCPSGPPTTAAVKAALERRVAELAKARPGITVEDEGARLRVGIPDRYRVGHEPHFAEVTAGSSAT
jgi:hypothetical protein